MRQALALDYTAGAEEQAQAGHERPLDRCARWRPLVFCLLTYALVAAVLTNLCTVAHIVTSTCGSTNAASTARRHLAPLERAFKARSGLEGGGVEDGALVLVERARGSDGAAMRADYLNK